MKDILLTLKVLIPHEVPEIRAAYIVPDADWIPEHAVYPCACIKDGESNFSEGMAETEDEVGFVRVFIYQQILKEEASLMGDGSKKGVLELAEDFRSKFNFNTIDDTVEYAYCPTAKESETLPLGKDVFVQRKEIQLKYER